MKFVLLSQRQLIAIVVALFASQASEACMCVGYPEDFDDAVATAYARADAVFLGDVVAIRSARFGILRQREVTFSVRERWKESIPDTTLILTNVGEMACGYKFKKRKSYLVFAHWDEQRKQLSTSFCDLNRTEVQAKYAIRLLEQLMTKPPDGN